MMAIFAGKSHKSAHSPSRPHRQQQQQQHVPGNEDVTILVGEGAVGRCAQQRCLQVYREGVISDGQYSQRRLYCSLNIPAPENAFNINSKRAVFSPSFRDGAT